MSRGRILVIRGGAIGDFILTLPALAALRRQFRQAHLEVLGYPNIATLALHAGTVQAVRSIEARALAGFFARKGELNPELGDYFASFDMIVSYLFDPDGIFQENVARVSTAQFLAGPHRPMESEPRHATEVFLQPLERLAIFGANPVPRLPGPVAPPPRPPTKIALHPGSGSERKNWPEARWEELLRLIARDTDWQVLLVGGEAEGDRLQRLGSLMPIDRLEVALQQPLPELAGRLTTAHAFLGHDSGITHLAAAVGQTGLALWGETNPEIWRPRSESFAILRPEGGLPGLAAEEVFRGLTARL